MHYPPNLRTRLSTKRRDKRTFCLRLARDLAHFDAHPEVWYGTVYAGEKLPPFLRLPPELRQQILVMTVNDDQLSWSRPNSHTEDLAVVCKVWAEDVRECFKLWNIREAGVREQSMKQNGGMREHFARYIEDLMVPVRRSGKTGFMMKKKKRKGANRANRRPEARYMA